MDRFRLIVYLHGLALLFAVYAFASSSDRDVKTISVKAKRYQYIPEIIRLKHNQPARLQVQSIDVLHGFHIPVLKIRKDLHPGKTTTIEIPGLDKSEYLITCDIFCGSGHSGMQAKLLVE